LQNYKDKSTSVKILEKLKINFPENAKIILNLGIAYSEINQFENAIKNLNESLKLKSKEPSALFYLISLYVQTGNFAEIIPLLELGEKEFSNIPEFNEKFQILKNKLQSILN